MGYCWDDRDPDIARELHVNWRGGTLMFTKVLVAYDRSAHAQAALDQAMDIARTQAAWSTIRTARSRSS